MKALEKKEHAIGGHIFEVLETEREQRIFIVILKALRQRKHGNDSETFEDFRPENREHELKYVLDFEGFEKENMVGFLRYFEGFEENRTCWISVDISKASRKREHNPYLL